MNILDGLRCVIHRISLQCLSYGLGGHKGPQRSISFEV